MMALCRLSSYMLDIGVYYTGLGPLSLILVGSAKKNWVVVSHQPCVPNKDSKWTTVFEQHQRYFEAKGDGRSSCMIFYEKLVAQLRVW